MSDTVYRFTVKAKDAKNNEGLVSQAKLLGFKDIKAIYSSSLYFVKGSLSKEQQSLLGGFIFSDALSETCIFDAPLAKSGDSYHVEVALKPGVSDPQSREAMRAIHELGITSITGITSGRAFDIKSSLDQNSIEALAEALLYNATIEDYSLGAITPHWFTDSKDNPANHVDKFNIQAMTDNELEALSLDRRAALNLQEMQNIQAYYRKQNRIMTDAEFETIAQTWSEHCIHKTFKSKILIDKNECKNYSDCCVNNILKTYIKKATDEIAAPWVLSAFVDNAGIIELDDDYEISFKVETHNHPSAIEPFGGANTGVGGVIRDVMGVSARPIAVTDVLCFGFPDTPAHEVHKGSLHPKRIIDGVIAGVEDYGNKMGIPTVNGSIHYDKAYATNPLVYCGCAGIAPRGRHKTQPAIGDRVVVIGGKTGRDGLRGATFSSMVMDAATGTIAGSSVQIGEPIIQKKVLDVLIKARDAGLYSAITDCGAGGLSSAVGEMSSKLGANVDIACVKLKYAGLSPWEIWLSEAQERMVFAVPKNNIEAFEALCSDFDVDFTDLGFFTGDGVLHVHYNQAEIISLDCGFLHGGPPQPVLNASPRKTLPTYPAAKSTPDASLALKKILSHHAVCSKEAVVRRYDHEVQGATILRPYDSYAEYDALVLGPQDAAVIQPREVKDNRGIAISNGFNHRYGIIDAHAMAAASIDEAVRNAVAVGANPACLAILDNFCMGDPKKPETLFDLAEAARACYTTALAFKTPFISGKDSFNNEYIVYNENSNDEMRVSIPPSLLISAIGIVPDIGLVPGSDLKQANNPIYIVGRPRFEFGGSVFSDIFGLPPAAKPIVPPFNDEAPALYMALHKAIMSGLVSSCHDISDGGLATCIAEMCIGSTIAANIDISSLSKKLGNTITDTEMLFAETNGCLIVEVPAQKQAEFEASMSAVFIECIGSTNINPRLSIKGNKTDFNISCTELREAFNVANKAGAK